MLAFKVKPAARGSGILHPRLCRAIWPDCPTKSWLPTAASGRRSHAQRRSAAEDRRSRLTATTRCGRRVQPLTMDQLSTGLCITRPHLPRRKPRNNRIQPLLMRKIKPMRRAPVYFEPGAGNERCCGPAGDFDRRRNIDRTSLRARRSNPKIVTFALERGDVGQYDSGSMNHNRCSHFL